MEKLKNFLKNYWRDTKRGMIWLVIIALVGGGVGYLLNLPNKAERCVYENTAELLKEKRIIKEVRPFKELSKDQIKDIMARIKVLAKSEIPLEKTTVAEEILELRIILEKCGVDY